MKARIGHRIKAMRQPAAEPEVVGTEAHFSPQKIAELWNVAPKTVQRLFRDVPGVLKLRHLDKGKREYVTLRIPESVLNQVYREIIR